MQSREKHSLAYRCIGASADAEVPLDRLTQDGDTRRPKNLYY